MANKRITIKDIANYLGVSYGVINKAINNKSGISDQMKKKVLDAADLLGYKVNKVAQCMARSTITIGIVIPADQAQYYQSVKRAVDKELERLMDYNVEGVYYKVENTNSVKDYCTAFEKCVNDGVHGIVLCAAPPFGMNQIMSTIKDTDIKVTVIGYPSIEDERIICQVHTDAYRSGEIAAHMMALMLPLESNIIVFVSNKNDPEHQLKLAGFMDNAKSYRINEKHLDIIGVYETLDSYDIMRKILSTIDVEGEKVKGIYCTTTNPIPSCEFIRDKKLNIKIVGTDIDKKSAQYIKNGILDCVVYQNVENHATTAVKVMYEYLAERKIPDSSIKICPQIVISSNIDGYFSDEGEKEDEE